MRNFDHWIDSSNAGYSARYPKTLLDAMMHVADPLADAAIAALGETAYDRAADTLRNVRARAATGDPACQAFVTAVAAPPAWLNPAWMRRGPAVSLAFLTHTRLSLTHSLFSGALFARATLVTRATGRLGADPASRIRETGAFLAAVLQPGGLAPGAVGFETAVRVRLLHASIRAWVGRAPGFVDDFVGAPIDQTMLAMTASLFSYVHLRSLARLGVRLSYDDMRAHHHLWRYVGHLLGIDPRLAPATLAQEQELWRALVAHQTFPDLFGEAFLADAVRQAVALAGGDRALAPFVRALFLHLSGPRWFGLNAQAARAPRESRLAALIAVSRARAVAFRFAPGAAEAMQAAGLKQMRDGVALARAHPYAMRIDENADAAAEIFARLARAVRARWA